MAKKRIHRKDFAKARRLVKDAQEASRAFQEWRELTCDELDCYIDEWVSRAGYIRTGTEFVGLVYTGTRKDVDKAITKEARRRENEVRRMVERVDRFVEKLAIKHEVYDSDIDLKTGEVKAFEGEKLPELEEEEAKEEAQE